MHMDQRFEWHTSLVSYPRMDVVLIQFKEQPGHLRERRRSPRVNACAESGGPCEPDQVSIIGVVIRVLVRQEYMAHGRQRHAGKHKLPGHTVAAVDHIRRVVADDHLGRGRIRLPRPWSATGPK